MAKKGIKNSKDRIYVSFKNHKREEVVEGRMIVKKDGNIQISIPVIYFTQDESKSLLEIVDKLGNNPSHSDLTEEINELNEAELIVD